MIWFLAMLAKLWPHGDGKGRILVFSNHYLEYWLLNHFICGICTGWGSLQNKFYFWPWWNFSRLLTEQSKSEGFDSSDRPSNLAQIWSKSSIFSPRDVEIWWMTSQNNRAPILYYIKLCASFQIHRWIQTEDTVQKRSIWVKIDDFFSVWPGNLMDDIGKQ